MLTAFMNMCVLLDTEVSIWNSEHRVNVVDMYRNIRSCVCAVRIYCSLCKFMSPVHMLKWMLCQLIIMKFQTVFKKEQICNLFGEMNIYRCTITYMIKNVHLLLQSIFFIGTFLHAVSGYQQLISCRKTLRNRNQHLWAMSKVSYPWCIHHITFCHLKITSYYIILSHMLQ